MKNKCQKQTAIEDQNREDELEQIAESDASVGVIQVRDIVLVKAYIVTMIVLVDHVQVELVIGECGEHVMHQSGLDYIVDLAV